jgi:peptidoglycan/LPS O-acetylase OafA/YrhL
MSKSTTAYYRPELDALRFFAFLMVFFHHAFVSAVSSLLPTLPWMLRIPAAIALGGQFGVDLFFILSAYLITELLLREKLFRGNLDVPAFYMRRILRIWPLYFVFLLFCLVLPKFSPAVFPGKAFVYFLFLSGNVYFTIYGGFGSPIAPLWSISIEEQFYLIWPWVVRCANRVQLGLVASCLILTALCTRWILLMRSMPRHVILFNSLTRVDAIGVGVVLAVALNMRVPRIQVAARFGCFVVGLAFWGLAASAFHVLLEHISTFNGMMGYGCGTMGAALLFVSFLGAPADGMRFLSCKGFTYLGRISYGLYVIHQFALETIKLILFKTLGRDPLVLRCFLALALTIPLAAFSYRWLEAPFLRIKERLKRIDVPVAPRVSDSLGSREQALLRPPSSAGPLAVLSLKVEVMTTERPNHAIGFNHHSGL